MPKLTQKMVDTTKAPPKGQVFYRDEELEGFALRVTPAPNRTSLNVVLTARLAE